MYPELQQSHTTADQASQQSLYAQIAACSDVLQLLRREIGQVIVGNDESVTFIILALLCKGHILIEGVPGIAKTTLIKAFASGLGLDFKRIQFTPDLLPADLIGTLVYNQKIQEFETKKGPLFAHLVLADEINRAPAKVQSALLEAMQEQQVTIGSNTYQLDEPFFVFATQNPIEQEGTYQLPEAQVDRFMFKLIVGHPNAQAEREILRKYTQAHTVKQIISRTEILAAQKLATQVYVDEKIVEYIVAIIVKTRSTEYIQCGASPRATIALYNASRAHALINKRQFVTPDDVKIVAPAILRHRVTVTYEALVQSITPDTMIQQILMQVPTP